MFFKNRGAILMKFKYDYLNKKRNLCIAFLCFSILVSVYIGAVLLNASAVFIIPVIVLFALAAIHYSKKGILVDLQKRIIVVRDDTGRNVFSFDKIRRVSMVEINKTNKGFKKKISLFLLGAKEEIEMWDYVYNYGKVYHIVFEVEDDYGGYFVYKSYFGWMYKERSKERVKMTEKRLHDFIDGINQLVIRR